MGGNKARWTEAEDAQLVRVVTDMNHAGDDHISWVNVASRIPDRTAKQCRERWKGVLDPSLNRSALTVAELQLIDKLIAKHGKCWSSIAAGVGNGRSELMIRNLYYARQRKHVRLGGKGGDIKLAPTTGEAADSLSSADSDSAEIDMEELDEKDESAAPPPKRACLPGGRGSTDALASLAAVASEVSTAVPPPMVAYVLAPPPHAPFLLPMTHMGMQMSMLQCAMLPGLFPGGPYYSTIPYHPAGAVLSARVPTSEGLTASPYVSFGDGATVAVQSTAAAAVAGRKRPRDGGSVSTRTASPESFISQEASSC